MLIGGLRGGDGGEDESMGTAPSTSDIVKYATPFQLVRRKFCRSLHKVCTGMSTDVAEARG